MKKKIKFYVVWEGHKSGVYNTWGKCKEQINNYKGAKYKSFLSLKEANNALTNDYKNYISKSKLISSDELPNLNSISVDAASSGNPGIMEYQGVDTKTKKLLFNLGPFKQGTNNIIDMAAGAAILKLKILESFNPITIETIAPSTIKKHAGKGNMNKSQLWKVFIENGTGTDEIIRDSDFLLFCVNEIGETTKIPKPFDDLVDAYFLNSYIQTLDHI